MSTAPTGPIPSIPLGHTAGFNSSARRSISPSPLSILLNSSSSIHSAESTSRTLDSQTHIGVIRSGSIDLAANQLPTQALQHIIDLAPRYLQLRHEEQSLQEAAKQLDSIQERLTTSQDNLTAFEAELVDVDAHIETMKKTRNRMFFGARAKYNQAILDLESRRTTIDLSIPAMIREIASLQLQRHDYRDVSRQISEIRDELQNIFSNVFEVYASSFSTERELNHKVVDILSKIRVLREQHRVSSRIHSIYIETRSSLENQTFYFKGKLKPASIAVPSVMEATQSFGYILQLRPDTVNPFMGVDQKYARPYDQQIEYMNTHLKAAMSRLERERHHIVLLAVASRRRQLRGSQTDEGISPTDNESQRSDSQLSSPRLSHVTLPYVPRPLSPRLPQASQPRMIPHGAIRRGSASLQVVSPLSGRHSSAQSTSAKGELPVWARQTVIDPPTGTSPAEFLVSAIAYLKKSTC
ncbi:hypothetical protein BSLG_003034 [Batrachochytrium salamandrivorans]|nr:hypothetical protein BSLG_003034 [Batrachochytrium salamandrivorans]